MNKSQSQLLAHPLRVKPVDEDLQLLLLVLVRETVVGAVTCGAALVLPLLRQHLRVPAEKKKKANNKNDAFGTQGRAPLEGTRSPQITKKVLRSTNLFPVKSHEKKDTRSLKTTTKARVHAHDKSGIKNKRRLHAITERIRSFPSIRAIDTESRKGTSSIKLVHHLQ